MRVAWMAVAAVMLTAAAAGGVARASHGHGGLPRPVVAVPALTVNHGDASDDEDAHRPDHRDGSAGFFQSAEEGTSTGAPAANVLLDCDTLLPNNEPQIAVDPDDANHMVASSNDYDSCCDAYYTTFDGGHTGAQGNMSAETDATGSDPVTSIDRSHGMVMHASLNYSGDFSDVVVSR